MKTLVSINKPNKYIMNKMDTNSITCNLLIEAFMFYEASLCCGPMRNHESLEWECLIDELLCELYYLSPKEAHSLLSKHGLPVE
jgi:hypothetical protein